jgi:hypothetical protein
MDTSERYINMCRQAKELQEMWKPTQGDWFVLYAEIETIGDYSEDLHPIDYREEFPISKKNCVWLPRIDQWLQILSDKNIIFGLSNYAQGDSVEITCTKLLYLNIYNKSWNGEDWIE